MSPWPDVLFQIIVTTCWGDADRKAFPVSPSCCTAIFEWKENMDQAQEHLYNLSHLSALAVNFTASFNPDVELQQIPKSVALMLYKTMKLSSSIHWACVGVWCCLQSHIGLLYYILKPPDFTQKLSNLQCRAKSNWTTTTTTEIYGTIKNKRYQALDTLTMFISICFIITQVHYWFVKRWGKDWSSHF